jgi:hypothetical protein
MTMITMTMVSTRVSQAGEGRVSRPPMTNEALSEPEAVAVVITTEVPTGYPPLHVAHIPVGHRIR